MKKRNPELFQAKKEMMCRNALGWKYIDIERHQYILPFSTTQIGMLTLIIEKYGYATAACVADPDIPAGVMGIVADIVGTHVDDVIETGKWNKHAPQPIKIWEIARLAIYDMRAIAAILLTYLDFNIFLPDMLPINALRTYFMVEGLYFCAADKTGKGKKLAKLVINQPVLNVKKLEKFQTETAILRSNMSVPFEFDAFENNDIQVK